MSLVLGCSYTNARKHWLELGQKTWGLRKAKLVSQTMNPQRKEHQDIPVPNHACL